MQWVLLDSSVYISALRRGEDTALAGTYLADDTAVWLSSVVLEELYAGAKAKDTHAVERLEKGFARQGRILVPNFQDWIQAGRTLASLSAKYDSEQIGRGRLTNVALIAMSAGRRDIQIITTNQKDFSRLAEIRSFRWKLIVL
ncbi:MAG: type II toxin-antitoxin system VapC family toxin [Candidatus Korobacteraceae bacterium]